MVDIQEKINNLSVMEQGLQQILNQKKNFQSQLLEVESALKEINSDECYKIIGNFMFKKDSQEIKKDLEEKRDLLNVRIKSFEKQEEESEKNFKSLQDEVLKELSKNKKEGE